MGSKLTSFFMCGIEIDLVLESGSNLTCVSFGGQNRSGLYAGRKILHFILMDRNLTWFLAWGSKLTWY